MVSTTYLQIPEKLIQLSLDGPQWTPNGLYFWRPMKLLQVWHLLLWVILTFLLRLEHQN